MRIESVMRPFVMLWAVVAVVLAAGAEDVKDNFEQDALGTTPSEWGGSCAVSNNVGSYANNPPGAPISDVNHNQMLSIAGTAMRSYSGVSGDRVVDMLVMADEMPDEELPAGNGDEHIKFAFDTNGCANLYHKLSAEGIAQWSKLSNNVYTNGQWVRVSFGFDYANQRCQLKVDGSPVVSAYGYRTASGSDQPGSWYCLASNATALVSIDFMGCGGVDDVVNALASSYTPSTGGASKTNDVDFAWFDKNGIAWCDPTANNAENGYTLKEAFDTGTDPYSANKLYMTNAEYTASKLKLTFNGYGKTYKVETKTSPFTDGSAGVDAGGEFTSSNEVANTTTWEGDFPNANGITYYRVRNVSVATAETVNQFAIMKVSSTDTNTLLALPWKSLSADTNNPTAITAANVVMTNNLVNGDWLLYYDGGFKGWCLNNGVWVATATASDKPLGGLTVAAAANNAALERGQAIWLVRTTANNRDLSQPFYLYGQYQATVENTTVPAGGCLLANPNVTSSFVVSNVNIDNAATGDEIRIPNGDGLPKTIKKFSDGWKAKKISVTPVSGGPYEGGESSTTWSSANADLTVPAGQGFMYIRTGNTAPTVKW